MDPPGGKIPRDFVGESFSLCLYRDLDRFQQFIRSAIQVVLQWVKSNPDAQ
jgi:hypothetical protein